MRCVESIHQTDYIAGLEDVGFDMLPGHAPGGSAFPVGPLNLNRVQHSCSPWLQMTFVAREAEERLLTITA